MTRPPQLFLKSVLNAAPMPGDVGPSTHGGVNQRFLNLKRLETILVPLGARLRVPRVMGETMSSRVGALVALPLSVAIVATTISLSAFAADLPAIKISPSNKVPACATPGRLTAFLEGRNGKLPAKFSTIAADYMRVGEELGIRWDTAFFQMLLETGNLTFTGDVSDKQNNFAGLGATGHHESGETFADVPTGVKAHLEHLLLYAGEKLDSPVAERTRKVQEWGVLTEWLKTIKGPMTYAQLARKWAPTSRHYVSDIENVQDSFYDGVCKAADPKPEMMALAKPTTGVKTASAAKSIGAEIKSAAKIAPETQVAAVETSAEAEPEAPPAVPAEASASTTKISGADLARKAMEEARASGSFVRSSLGAGSLAKIADVFRPAAAAPAKAAIVDPAASDTPKVQPAVTIINAPKPEAETTASVAEPKAAAAAPQIVTIETPAKVQTAALGGLKSAVAAPAPMAQPAVAKCRVWTASYGGGHAVIVKASADLTTNYTVLDVNEGSEKREAEAYISAYAKGGQTVGEFQSQTQALDKAFELCPEG